MLRDIILFVYVFLIAVWAFILAKVSIFRSVFDRIRASRCVVGWFVADFVFGGIEEKARELRVVDVVEATVFSEWWMAEF